MTAQARTTGRRLLARKATRTEASASRQSWENLLGRDADVRVELGVAGTTDTQPYGITARKPRNGGHS